MRCAMSFYCTKSNNSLCFTERNIMINNINDDASSSLFDTNGVFGIADDPWPAILEKLQILREADLQKREVQFCIWPGAPVSEIVDFLVETFVCLSNRQYSWGRLVFQDFDMHDPSHYEVLSVACAHQLFKYLWIAPLSTRGSAERMNEQTACILRDAMIGNQTIQEICVFMQLTKEAFAILGEGLRESLSLRKLCLHLGWNRRHEDTFAPVIQFLQGLEMNTSLETLEVDGVPEDWPANILHALTGHPKLQALSLKKCTWGEQSFAALALLIQSPNCVLCTLDISYPDLQVTRKMNGDFLADALKFSHSVQTVKMRYLGLDYIDFSKVWVALSCWPRLVEVDLTGNDISSLDGLGLNEANAIRVRQLDFTHNPILNSDEEENNLLNFLKRHPELKCLGEQFDKSQLYSSRTQHMLDLNSCGRVLFRDGYQTRLSIWPVVLDRVNTLFQEHPERRASVLYHLIHGLSTNL